VQIIVRKLRTVTSLGLLAPYVGSSWPHNEED